MNQAPHVMGRVAIFGDIGGHAEELYGELVRLGADPESLRLPADLTVVQVGDLIHRGPDSDAVLKMVDRWLTTQPDQWVQLSGNHEDQYLHPPRFQWPERLAKPERTLLRSWWADGRMRVAAGIRTAAGEQMLVTHAGLTAFVWESLGSPATVEDATAAVNALIPDHPQLTRAGSMLGERPSLMAGPWWAEAGPEVYASWGLHVLEENELPFSQAHGHSSAFDFAAQRFRNLPLMLREHLKVDDVDRHVTLTLPGGRIVGVDPGHGSRPARRWAPLVLPEAAVVAR